MNLHVISLCADLLDEDHFKSSPHAHPQKAWAPLQVSAVDKLVSKGFSEPSSSVRRTGVPALSLHPGVRATAARTKEFPPRDGSFYQPAEQPTAVWRPQRSMNRFLFLQHLEASSQCFCADRIAAVCLWGTRSPVLLGTQQVTG